MNYKNLDANLPIEINKNREVISLKNPVITKKTKKYKS